MTSLDSDPVAKEEIQIELTLPRSGKLFFEEKADYKFCKPHLLPLKSLTLEKLEKMQVDAQQQMQESRRMHNTEVTN